MHIWEFSASKVTHCWFYILQNVGCLCWHWYVCYGTVGISVESMHLIWLIVMVSPNWEASTSEFMFHCNDFPCTIACMACIIHSGIPCGHLPRMDNQGCQLSLFWYIGQVQLPIFALFGVEACIFFKTSHFSPDQLGNKFLRHAHVQC